MSQAHLEFALEVLRNPTDRERRAASYGMSETEFAQELLRLDDRGLTRFLRCPRSPRGRAAQAILSHITEPNRTFHPAGLADILMTQLGLTELLNRRDWAPAAVAAVQNEMINRIAALCEPITGDDATEFTQQLSSTPVLLRLISTGVLQFDRFVRELSARLADDRDALRTVFDFDSNTITEIESRLSDFHDGGRCVCALTGRNGVRVVYKPRSLVSDAVAEVIFDAVNRIAGKSMLQVPRFLTRGGYGYAEYIAGGGRDVDADSIASASWLTVVAMILGTRDLHAQNVIVTGECATVLDTECLMLPDRRRDAHAAQYPGLYELEQACERSIYGSLLPYSLVIDTSGSVIDNAGLPGLQKFELPFRARLIEVYKCVEARKRDLMSAIRDSGKARIRYVPRDTRNYADIAKWLHNKLLLTSEPLRSLALDILFTSGPNDYLSASDALQIVRHERVAIDRLDIPTFHVDLDSTDLDLGACHLSAFFVSSARDMAIARASGLCDRDLQSQLHILGALLRDSMKRRRAVEINFATPAYRTGNILGSSAAPLSRRRLLRSVDAHLLSASEAFCTSPEQPAWPIVDVDHTGTSRGLFPVDVSLYRGLAGTAFYLAHRAPYVRSASTLHLLGQQLEHTLNVHGIEANAGPFGAFDGIYGVPYALQHVADKLRTNFPLGIAPNGKLTAPANDIFDTLPSDMMSGLAGIVCVLEDQASSGSRMNAIADICARILAERVLDGGTAHSDHEKGFAHGTLGIFHALARSSRVGGVVREAANHLRVRASEMIADGAFNNDISWCRGMTGVLCCSQEVKLTRLIGMHRLAAILEQLAEDAHDTSLCCGLAGFAGALTTVDKWLQANRKVTRALSVAREKCADWIEVHAHAVPALEELGLMRGLPGVALAMFDTGRKSSGKLLQLAAPRSH